MRKLIKKAVKDMKGLHPYSRNVLHGSFQFTIILYIFAFITYYMAPYAADYFETLRYHTAALEVAPVTLGAGIVAALLCDLALRKKEQDDDDEDDK